MAKVALYFDLRNPPGWRQDWHRLYDFTLEMCEEGERLGAAGVWLSEHHLFEDGYLNQPLTYAAAVAARTKRMRIGTAVLIAPFREPAQIAEEAAVVDLISNGRLDLGIGTGYRIPEFELYNKQIQGRYGKTDEVVRKVRELWTSGRLVPPPIQDPVPIWMGYQGPQGARRCGVLGEGLLSVDPALLEPYTEGLIAGGHDPASARMSGGLTTFVTKDPERDWPVVSKHLGYQIGSYRKYMVEGTGKQPPREVDPERLRAKGLGNGIDGLLVDTPENVAQSIRERITGLPVDTVFVWTSLAGMPEAMVAEHVRTLCEDLSPLIADI